MKISISRALLAAILALNVAVPVAAQPPLLATLNPDVSGWGWPAQPHVSGFDFAFGYSLDTDGPWLLAGMPGAQPHEETIMTGALALYRRSGDTWLFDSHLTRPADPFLDFAGCGYSAGIVDGVSNTARVFGCPFADSNAYEENGRATLRAVSSSGVTTSVRNPPGGDDGVRMGVSVSIARASDGTAWAAVGAPGSFFSSSPHSRGKVAIWRLSEGNWFHEQDLWAGDGVGGDRFGHSVSISVGEVWAAKRVRVAVGAPQHDGWRGAVYVFERDQDAGTWSELVKLTVPAGDSGDFLGWSVAHKTAPPGEEGFESLLVAGAIGRRPGGELTQWPRGTVSIWRQSGWSPSSNYVYEGEVIFPCFPVPGAICDDLDQEMEFGSALALEGETIWIGAPRFDMSGSADVGRVYSATYNSAVDLWLVNGMLTPGPLSEDCGPFGVGRSGGRFGHALAAVPGGVAVGYPFRGCQILTNPPSDPGPRWGQVRIYGTPDEVFADRFD